MHVIGLTGGVGCGKSMVMDVLRKEYDALTLVADEIGRMAMEKGTKTYQDVIRCFGEGILDENQNIKRAKIAEIIFKDDAMLKKQNEIIHPFVMEYVSRKIRQSKKPIAVIESAILVQAGYKNVCDEIWAVLCDEDTRRARLKSSRGYSDEKIDAIMRKQWSDEEYMENSHRIIRNDGDEQSIRRQLTALLPSYKT